MHKIIRAILLCLGLSTSLISLVSGCGTASFATSAATTTSSTTTSTASASLSPSSSTALSTPGVPISSFSAWNSIAIAVPASSSQGTIQVMNYNYLNGQGLPFIPQPLHDPRFDGISSAGQDLLYQLTSSGHTFYYRGITQLPNTGFFYELNEASAGNALWLPDNHNVLVLAYGIGIMQVDTLTGHAQTVLSLPLTRLGLAVNIATLVFYHAGYLYFIGAEGACQELLCRVQLSNGTVQQVSPFRSSGASYWLSPTGSTIYFANQQGPAGEPGIYAVNPDGTNARLLRRHVDGLPIGYAADNSLVIINQVAGKFQAVQLGSTPGQDRVVFADVAPGAVSLCPRDDKSTTFGICDSSIAFAPYGHALVVQATFADGTNKLWSDDLVTGHQFILQAGVGSGMPVILLGWDRRST